MTKALPIVIILVVFSSLRSDGALKLSDFNNFDMVNFNLVYGPTHMNFTRYYIGDYLKLFADGNFSSDRKTLLYVHGWIENYYSESTETVVNAYIQRQDHNIIVIDWGQYSFGEYFSLIPRFTQISKMLAMLLLDMFERGLDINQLHCVGHSFGSHIMGIMGRELFRNSLGKYKLKRISALDPAHFGFWPALIEQPLSRQDAEFVDAIHSDVNFIGTRNRVGHVDFYPNDGQLQPGCPPFRFFSFMDIVNSFCSHQQAWRYWAETVKPEQERIFRSSKCQNYKNFKDGKCSRNQINFMGYGATASARGVFYIQLETDRNFIVDESYFTYLATSLNYRSDLARIASRLLQLFSTLTQSQNVV